MAVVRSTEDLTGLSDTPLGLACSLCEKELQNLHDCLQTKCNHTFHKQCISKWLGNSTECPNCQKLCHERDLLIQGSKKISRTKSIRGRGRGSAAKHYNTRSQLSEGAMTSRDAPDNSQNQTNNPNSVGNNHNETNPQLLDFNETQESTHLPSHDNTMRSNRRRFNNRRPAVDYDQIARMISLSIQQAFANLNIQNTNQSPIVSIPQSQLNFSPQNTPINKKYCE